MAIYTNLPIYKATYSLLFEVSRMMPDLPRDCRYSIGQDLKSGIMHILVLIYRANRSRDKSALISQMRETLLEVQIYMRLMCDLRYISEKKYLVLAEQSSGMSKQLAAWEKSENLKHYGGIDRGE